MLLIYHVDIWDLVNISPVHAHRYFLIIMDDYTRHTWIYLKKVKYEIGTLLQNFVTYAKNQFRQSIKIIRSDNGKQFSFSTFFL